MKKSILPMIVLSLLLLGCGGQRATEDATAPEVTAAVVTPVPQYSIQYIVDGTVVGSETVRKGDSPVGIPTEEGFRCWLNDEGKTVRLDRVEIVSDCVFTAAFVPVLNDGCGLFEIDKNGLFRPDEEFTRSDAVRLVYNLLKNKPATEMFLKDVTTTALCYKSASTLCAAGWLELEDGAFNPDVPITLADLSALLERLFPVEEVDEAMRHCELPLTRGRAAELFCELLNLECGTADYPDVPPEHPQYKAISAMGMSSKINWGDRTGFVFSNGRLYCFDERGYFLKNTDVGTLHFGEDGAYTSGDAVLDELVNGLMRKKINPGEDREAALKKAYLYVRDSYLYLRRNYYEVGETGWEIAEATTMLQSGKGNCYNFTGTFWALARALGYEAQCVSGLVGQKADPHSWVEILWDDGVTYIFDPETEMSYRLKDMSYDCYKMTYEQGEFWSYYRGE